MSSTTTDSTRRCPVCDAPNSHLSLFCAECGASLNAPGDNDDTAAYRPIPASDNDDAQQTATFEPGSYAGDTSHSTSVRADTPDDGNRSTWEDISAAPPVPVWTPAQVTFQPEATQGACGFVLGVIAVLLMLSVFLLWTWATLLDQGTRDSIQDFFGFIG